MPTINYNQPTSFKGRVFYTNKEAKKLLQNSREGINLLKHHCGNSKFDHYISANEVSVAISTSFERSVVRADGIDGYNLTTIIVNDVQDRNTVFNRLVRDHLLRYKNWKRKLDAVPQTVQNNIESNNICQKFANFCKKLFNKR